MNLALQDPFSVAKEYPDTLVHTLSYGHSVCLQFNRKGDYLACGLSDGTVLIYELLTTAIVAVLRRGGHVRPITSITWSQCGRYLLSSSQDWSCILWDLRYANARERGWASPAVVARVKFAAPIWSACLHPANPFVFTASLFEDAPVHVTIPQAKATEKEIKTETEKEIKMEKTEIKKETEKEIKKETETTAENGTGGVQVVTLQTQPKTDEDQDSSAKHHTLVSIFTPGGEYIICGTSKGWLNVLDAQSTQTVHSVKVANCNIKGLVMSANGRKLAVNCSDRIIRQIRMPDFRNVHNPAQWDFDVEHRYQDVVNRLQWNGVTFNANADFLVASTFGQSSQDLYVWETGMGSLIKILEGSHEELIDVKWNYNKCMIGSTGLDSGSVYLWSIQFPSKWSALAPDFVEIDENEEYQERENEFDILDETEVIKKRMEEEDLEIDIVSSEQTDVRGFDTQIASFVIPIDYESSVVS